MYFSRLRDLWSFRQGRPVLCRGGFGAENGQLHQGEHESRGFPRDLFNGAAWLQLAHHAAFKALTGIKACTGLLIAFFKDRLLRQRSASPAMETVIGRLCLLFKSEEWQVT